jgi:hypothetical protein
MIVGSVVSAGGLTAVVVKIFRKEKQKTTANISESNISESKEQ